MKSHVTTDNPAATIPRGELKVIQQNVNEAVKRARGRFLPPLANMPRLALIKLIQEQYTEIKRLSAINNVTCPEPETARPQPIDHHYPKTEAYGVESSKFRQDIG